MFETIAINYCIEVPLNGITSAPKLMKIHQAVQKLLVGDFQEIYCGGNAIQGDLDAIISNPITSIILKLLSSKLCGEPC
jgi:hypothetical protein